MRLHRLEVTAFGPFAGTETVDFDALNDAGLFLLTGATGAGKTSILDAVCFTLYGSVPGVRGVKTLKSQHADELTRPEVVLEFSVRERRFVIRRSPEWSRPKRRGTGTRVETASASLAEVIDGDERFLTARAAEVGLQVSSLIGMQASQFQQVAMLPQGEFQRFLQATTQDRHDVLQHLFQTDRFARIESWVQDRSRSLREQAALRERAVQRLLDALAERSGAALPTPLGPEWLASSVGDGSVVSWADTLVEEACKTLGSATAAHEAALAAQTGARTRLEAARVRQRLHLRRVTALHQQSSLRARQGQVDAARAALDADVRAAACLPVLGLLDDAEAELTLARDLFQEQQRALGSLSELTLLVPDVDWDDPESIRAVSHSGQARLGQVRALSPRVRDLVEDRQTIEDLESRLVTHQSEQARLQDSMTRLPEERARVRHQLEAATALAAREEALGLQLDRALARCVAAERLPDALTRRSAADDVARAARDTAADAREAVQDLTDRRLAGMAAELAGDLTDGVCCQVCGSVEHPAPARVAQTAVTERQQAEAVAAYDRAQRDHLSSVEQATSAARLIAQLQDSAGPVDAAGARSSVDTLRRQLDTARSARVAATRLHQRCAALEDRLALGSTRLSELSSVVAATHQTLTTCRSAVDAAEAAVAELLGDAADPSDLPVLEQRLVRMLSEVDRLRTLIEKLHRAQVRQRDLFEQADRTATSHAFDSAGEVKTAVLSPGESERLAGLVTEHVEALAHVSAVLRDSEVPGIDDTPPPDVEAAQRCSDLAEHEVTVSMRTYHHSEQALADLSGLRARLDQALTHFEPLRHSSSRAESMSKLVRGMGNDNHLQMRLSAYVLARRLDQVLDAANERLAHMRDQRYLLQRTGRAARRSSPAGLGLEVVDQWTGDVRDPATLSGGETFVVSLALALGLADVVTQEAGGVEIETLFVDEGFGSLDADTLDDVMDRLDGLRAGGRTVGVVSHVSELRTRIPTQLHVHKSSRGSWVRQSALVG
ncbi:MAG: SMC family ATPase [Nocardioidaceae bacterium]|nr:SMC family ATPase [Nocardioidaceae bacterium]